MDTKCQPIAEHRWIGLVWPCTRNYTIARPLLIMYFHDFGHPVHALSYLMVNPGFLATVQMRWVITFDDQAQLFQMINFLIMHFHDFGHTVHALSYFNGKPCFLSQKYRCAEWLLWMSKSELSELELHLSELSVLSVCRTTLRYQSLIWPNPRKCEPDTC